MDLLTSHQVDATVEEEQSGDEEKEENEAHGKATESSSNKGSTIDTTAVPKLTDHNKISSTSVGISQGPSNVDAGISNSSSNNNNFSSSSKTTVNVILNNVAPPVPTFVTAAASSASGYKQQSISSTVTVNSTAAGKLLK
jgi:hypothetical protein